MSDTKGNFVKELKNRFLCEVNIDGVPQECYIASSCHLGNFIDLSGKEVILREIKNPKARTKYAVQAFMLKSTEIPLEMAVSNRVVERELHRRIFSFLGPRKEILREQKIDNYKCDLFVKDTNTLIEIKSVLTTERRALFPTVYSERAVQQLASIERLLTQGFQVYYFLVSLSPKVSVIEINDASEDFKNSFQRCAALGMKYHGFSITTKDGISTIKRAIPIEFNND